MVINLKYYVITIVAIFLAIGVGMIIGIMLDGQDLMVQQQQQLVAQLESKFDEFKIKQDTLQEKIESLTFEKEKNEKFINMIYPQMAKGKLKDLDVVIIETSEHYDYSGITDAFKKAGASSATNILIKDVFTVNNESDASQIAKDFNLSEGTKEEIQNQLIKKLCSALVLGNDMEFINKLKERKMIDYENIVAPADYVVIAGGSIDKEKNALDKIDIPFINCIKSSNIPIMAVEKLNVVYSNISDYKKLRISTVDNVDTIIGKISMLMVVSGREGHFGEKETAEELVPEGFITVE